MFDITPLHTKIEKVIQAMVGNVILENPTGFPREDSNLYCAATGGRMIWIAEKPEAKTLYTRVKLNEDGDTISAYTLGGHACELSLTTGKLISQTVIK
jgi:hypothetical protein